MDDGIIEMFGSEDLRRKMGRAKELEGLDSHAEADFTDIPGLYRAAMEGNWQHARRIFREKPNAKAAKISTLGMTALHVAASCGRSDFVVKLVKTLSSEELEARDQVGRTALHHVALAADVEAARALVKRNPDLPHHGDMHNLTPLYYAAKWRHPAQSQEMVDYLHLVTEDKEPCRPFTGDSAADLIVAMTTSGSYDTTLRTLQTYPELALKENDQRMSILRALATQPLAFRSGNKLSIWESFIYKLVIIDTEHKHEHSPTSKNGRDASASFFKFVSKFREVIMKLSKVKQSHVHALGLVRLVCRQLQEKGDINFAQEYFIPGNDTPILHLAIEHGVFELVQECLNRFPDLIWYADRETKRLLLHAAIEHRQVKIFNHIIKLNGNNTKAYADLQADEKNNILHLAAKLAPTPQLTSVPGPAFQMQLEFQWFKAVEAIVYYELGKQKNGKGRTPRELFSRKHTGLLKDAKEWIKDTSNSCMVVSTLVATVAFAAMITVPGGNDSDTGMPVLARKKLFAVFSISNGLSMISSAVSLLMFLSVQTSRHTEDDFLKSLPTILVRGLVFLFIAVITMMISFGTAVGLSLQSTRNWAYIPITIVACFPAIIFFWLQLPLLLQTLFFRSRPGIFGGYRLLANDMA